MGQQSLTWSAVIPSYRRPTVLRRCIRELLKQEPAPKQIIVVGANIDDSTTEAPLVEEFERAGTSAQLLFRKAEASSAIQRNAGLDLLDADVCLFIDDDFFVQPGFMRRHLDIYEADEEGRIAGIQGRPVEGVEAAAWYRKKFADDTESHDPASAPPRGLKGHVRRGLRTLKDPVRRAIWEGLYKFMGPMFPPEVFVPAVSLPADLAERFSLEPAEWMRGCCFSTRVSLAGDARFAKAFYEWAAGEDIDYTYRLSLRGAICRDDESWGYHVQDDSGRPDTEKLVFTSLLNLAYIARTSMPQSKALEAHMIAHHRRVAASWAVMGMLGGRGLADYRAGTKGVGAAKDIFAHAPQEADEVYASQRHAWMQR